MVHRKWVVKQADKEAASAISEKFNIDPFLAFLLVSRGMDNDLAVHAFLHAGEAYSSPFGFCDMEQAVARIQTALDTGERMCIYGDYDCDGVTATALLYSFLEALGGDVLYYIPDREKEGYGMNPAAIDTIYERGARLIITVDNGISSFDEADYIYQKGMELVVTDHHQVGDRLPRAEAVVNPHREENEISFRDFAGVGVAFKLACALYDGDVSDLIALYSDLIAIGTLADLVPMVGENRGLVRAGLECINQSPRVGVQALKQAAGSAQTYSAGDVTFRLCPRINAAGRMDSALRALELLLSEDEEDAAFRAAQLCEENQHRQELERSILEDIEQKIAVSPDLLRGRVLVVAGENYHPGVIGIVASHLVERYGKPAVVITLCADGTASGSARSIEGFNLFEAIQSCADCLTRYGGHPMAAGLGLLAENVAAFRETINAYAAEAYPSMPVQKLVLDCKLSPFYLTLDLVDSLSLLEPCGTENNQALFGLYGLEIVSVTPIGEGKHIRIEAQKKGKKIRIVQFGVSPEQFPYLPGEIVDCAVRLSKNIFKERTYLSVRAEEIRRSGIDDDLYFAQLEDYRRFLAGAGPKGAVYPDRAACSAVYRYLKNRDGWRFDLDELYFALQDRVTYAQMQFALQAFEEAGLIERKTGIRLLEVQVKADLENTAILKTVKGRTGIDQGV